MEVIPAIDVVGGRVTRLCQGAFDAATTYEASVAELAAAYVARGARRLHLIDLDGARAGAWGLAAEVAEAAALGLAVQTAGGLRSRDDVERALAAGADRVLIGSAAVADPARVAVWVAEFGAERVGICLDARPCDSHALPRLELGSRTPSAVLPLRVSHDPGSAALETDTSTALTPGAAGGEAAMATIERWEVAIGGWKSGSGLDPAEVWAAYPTAPGFVLATDISRDGMLAGPGLGFYRALRPVVAGAELIASGGVTTPEDVRALAAAGCDACVVGRAVIEDPGLYADLREAAS